MVDQMRVRPLSGEIMTDARAAATGHDRAPEAMADIVDAEFETVASAGPAIRREGRAPAPASGTATDTVAAAPEGMDVLRGGAGGAVSRRAGPLFWFCGAVVALAAFWVSGGHAVGPLLFGPASAQAGASVRLVDVRSKVEEHQGRRFVYVDGAVSNEGTAAASVQPLAIEVRGDDNSTTRYILHVSEARIEPGERVPFSSRLDAPSGGVAGVMVTIKREGGA